MESLIRWVALLLAGYAAICAILYMIQDHLVFFTQPLLLTPRGDNVLTVEVERGDVTLRGWAVNPESDGPLVIYFGGNAEELSTVVAVFARLRATTVLVNYRGYGASDGWPSAALLVADARAVVEVMSERFGCGRDVILFGRSLGAGIAVKASDAAEVDGMILMSPYLSLTRLAKRQFPFVPVDWLFRHDIDVTPALTSLPPRVLVLYADPDYIIPTAESRAFIDRLQVPPEVVEFAGGHNVPLTNFSLWPHVRAFVEG